MTLRGLMRIACAVLAAAALLAPATVRAQDAKKTFSRAGYSKEKLASVELWTASRGP